MVLPGTPTAPLIASSGSASAATRSRAGRATTSWSPAVTPSLLDDAIGPAAARLHRAALNDAGGAPEVIDFGMPPRRPAASVIVPLYRNLRFLRFQLAAFARDPELRRAELVHVLDSPEQRHEVEHLLRGMAAMLDMPLRLVVMPRNGGYAAACNAGAAVAQAPALLFLNSDVLPAAPGWLGRMRARLARDRRHVAVGPKLIFDGGTVQHAGLLFRRGEDALWLNDHYCKGFPRQHPDARRARRVPAVTGAAQLVRRHAFTTAGGFCTDYIVGDFEDSDLCLKLRDAGGEIAYEPGAELYHFERQSIALHDGHARRAAARAGHGLCRAARGDGDAAGGDPRRAGWRDAVAGARLRDAHPPVGIAARRGRAVRQSRPVPGAGGADARGDRAGRAGARQYQAEPPAGGRARVAGRAA